MGFNVHALENTMAQTPMPPMTNLTSSRTSPIDQRQRNIVVFTTFMHTDNAIAAPCANYTLNLQLAHRILQAVLPSFLSPSAASPRSRAAAAAAPPGAAAAAAAALCPAATLLPRRRLFALELDALVRQRLPQCLWVLQGKQRTTNAGIRISMYAFCR